MEHRSTPAQCRRYSRRCSGWSGTTPTHLISNQASRPDMNAKRATSGWRTMPTKQTWSSGPTIRGGRADAVPHFAQGHWRLRLLHRSCSCTFSPRRPPKCPRFQVRPKQLRLRGRILDCRSVFHRQGGQIPACFCPCTRKFFHFLHFHLGNCGCAGFKLPAMENACSP